MRTPIDGYILAATGQPDYNGYTASREPGAVEAKDVAFRRLSFEEKPVRAPAADNAYVQVGSDDIYVEMIQGIDEDSFKRVCAESIAAATGADPQNIEWEELLRGGLQTALETQVVVFRVEGVSRACTHQLVRTRKASFHQQSQRASWYGEAPEVRVAESVWSNTPARQAFLRAMRAAHEAYDTAVREDISYQDARLVLPEGTTNVIVCEYPLRTWLDTYSYRACQLFQWEIQTVFRKMKRELVEAHPWMEPYVKISCEKTKGALDDPGWGKDGKRSMEHHCTYQGHEFVEDQCDFEWARESNRSFVPEPAHRIGPKDKVKRAKEEAQ